MHPEGGSEESIYKATAAHTLCVVARAPRRADGLSRRLCGFSAPPVPADASALDVFKALSAGQSNGVVRTFSNTKSG